MWKEFKEFALRGNIIDVAVGFVIGVAFGSVTTSLVNDIIMPPIGLVIGKVDFNNLYILLKQGDPAGPYASLQAAKDAGAVSVNYGAFVTTVISFLIIAFVVFLLVKAINQLYREQEKEPAAPKPETKECPYCLSTIPEKAIRCPYCTSELSRI